MSVNYSVIRKGLSISGRPADITKIIGGLGCGVIGDSGCLEEKVPQRGSPKDEEFILFDREHIGRGISVKPSKNKLELRMLSPTCPEEIDAFFDVIERAAAQFGKCRIMEEDSEEVPLSDIPQKREYFRDFNRSAIMSFTDLSENSKLAGSFKDGGCLFLFGARFPLELDRETAEKIHAAPDPAAAFGEWFHKCQSTAARYISPTFFKVDGRIVGAYIIGAGEDCIVPLKPKVPFGMTLGDGVPLKADRWEAFCVSDKEEKPLGKCGYERFIESVRGGSRPFDGGSIIVNITEADAKNIFTE